jgi:Transposase
MGGDAGRQVFAITPRYRDRYRASGAKSDPFDAMVLANILRTDRTAHHALAEDSEAVLALRVLTRAQQDAVWESTELAYGVRTLLNEFYPAVVAAFERGREASALRSAAARRLLMHTPTPGEAAKLTRVTLAAQLRPAGRTRGVTAEAILLQQHLRVEQLHQPAALEAAYGRQLQGLVRQLDAVGQTLTDLEAAGRGGIRSERPTRRGDRQVTAQEAVQLHAGQAAPLPHHRPALPPRPVFGGARTTAASHLRLWAVSIQAKIARL